MAANAAWNEHLKNALRSVFADFNSAAEDLARRLQQNDLDVFARSGELNAFGQFAQHRFVQ